MSGRFLLTICFAALNLACTRVPRLDAPTAQSLHHFELQDAERDRCVERLAAISNEFASLENHPWAGRYSWSRMQWCGSCPQHAEVIALAPKAGVVWLYEGRSLKDSFAIDHGDIVAVDEDRIVVRWAINVVSPHLEAGPGGGRLMSEELERVKWGTSELLIPAVRMPAFCGSVSAGADATLEMFPRRGGWKRGYQDSDEIERPSGWPRVPPAWEDYLVRVPIRALAELDHSARLEGAYGPDDSDHTEAWSYTARLRAGSMQGVRPGIVFFAQEPTCATPHEDDFRVGDVCRLEDDAAWIRFTGWCSSKDGPVRALPRFTMSTSAPVASSR